MGREIRRVPPNWQHPKQENGRDQYQPLFNRHFSTAVKEWKDGFAKWEAGERPDYCSSENKNIEFWEWDGEPPDREYYRPYRDEEATWFQVYETVSEGTPVTPPFATAEELVEYLSKNGDFWDQARAREGRIPSAPWGDEAARKFVGCGWAPSMLVTAGKVYEPRNMGEIPK